MSRSKLNNPDPSETTPSDRQAETVESTSTTDELQPEQTELSKDLVFELLKESRRRLLLRLLDENTGKSTLGEMAELIAAEENGCDRSQISSDERKRAYVGLYQCHLPKMDDANVIDFDRARGDIELRPEANELLPYLYFDQSDHESTTDFPYIGTMIGFVRNCISSRN